MEADRISKRARLDGPISRVWRAISQAWESGEWFRTALVIEGAHVRGRITYPSYEHLTAKLFVERMYVSGS